MIKWDPNRNLRHNPTNQALSKKGLCNCKNSGPPCSAGKRNDLGFLGGRAIAVTREGGEKAQSKRSRQGLSGHNSAAGISEVEPRTTNTPVERKTFRQQDGRKRDELGLEGGMLTVTSIRMQKSVRLKGGDKRGGVKL